MSTRAPAKRLPYPLRIIQARPRLAACIVVGIIVSVALPSAWRMSTRLLVGWDIGVALYLGLVCGLMVRSQIHHIRKRAALNDEGQFALLVLTVAAALASLGGILAELGSSPGMGRTSMQLALAAATVVLSWGFVHI